MAQVVHANPEQMVGLGRSMGLPAKRRLTDDQLRRIYITVIRQNWHLLPENQIIELLGWDQSQYRFTLKEDDFLDIKLGRVKPACEPIRYSPSTDQQQRRAAESRPSLNKWFGKRLSERCEDLFAFVQELSTRPSGSLRNQQRKPDADVVDLSSGWTIVSQSGTQAAGDNLRWFLAERMGVKPAPEAAANKLCCGRNLIGPDGRIRFARRGKPAPDEVLAAAAA